MLALWGSRGAGIRRPIVAGILAAVALVAVVGFLLLQSNSPGQPPSVGCPCGSYLALSEPTEQSIGGDHWYNFSFQTVGGGIVLGDLGFQVVTASGANVSPSHSWSLSVVDASSKVLGTCEVSGPNPGTWTSGAQVPISIGLTLALSTGPTDLHAQGDMFEVSGVGGGFQGTVITAIP